MHAPIPALITVIWAVIAVLAPRQVHASDQVPYGARAIAMGGAYTSVVDDPTSLFWNPSGMVLAPRNEFIFTRADLFGTGIVNQALGLVFPRPPHQAFGIGWYGSGFDDPELEFKENEFNVGYAFVPVQGFAFGATGKYLTRNISLDGTSVRRGGGFGLDLGARASLPMGFSIGLVSQDVTTTKVQYTNAPTASTAEIKPNTRGSLSHDLGSRGVAAFDVDDR